MIKEKVARITTKFINIEIIALIFLLPLFFLPVTTEFFEFNKLTLFVGATILGWIAFGIKAAATGEISLGHTPFDLPVVGLWIATLITTVFSEHLTSSLIGHYARWHPSLVTVTVFTAFYFLVAANIEEWVLKCVRYTLIAVSAIGGLLFLLHYFEVNTFGQTWSEGNTFTPFGSPTLLALLLGLSAPMAIRNVVEFDKTILKILNTLLAIFTLFTVTLLNSPAGWAALAVATLTTLLATGFKAVKRNWRYVVVILAVLAASMSLILIPSVREKTPFRGGSPREVILDLRTSWSVAATSFRQRPFWGSGPSTFLFDFTRYKPLRFNYTSFWRLKFDKPLSEYLLAFAEMGILGVLAYLFLITVSIREVIRHRKEKLVPIAAGILAAFFFTYSSVISSFLLLVALASIGGKKPESAYPNSINPPSTGSAKGYITLALTLILGFFLSLGFYRTYKAEVAQRRAVLAFADQNYQLAYAQQLRAISSFTWRDIYHANLGQTSAAWANQMAAKEDPTEEDQNNIQILVAQAIQEAKKATELSPLNANNWEMLAQTYRNMIGFAQGAADWAVNSYFKAINLDLFNPLLRVNLGGLFYQAQDYERAVEQFRAAVSLKNNFGNAHYNLGRAYQEAGNTTKAIEHIETALRLTPEGSPGYTEAKEILDQLKQEQGEKTEGTSQ